MDPTDLVYYLCTPETFRPWMRCPVRWLDWEADFPMVQAYWTALNTPLTRDQWLEARDIGYQYAAVIEDRVIRSCAAAWNYSVERSELSSVSTDPAFRCLGYAKSVCSFITADILCGGQFATMCTATDNLPMQHTAERLGYLRIPIEAGLHHQRLMRQHLERRLAEIGNP